MKTLLEVLPTILIVVTAILVQFIFAEENSTTPGNEGDDFEDEEIFMIPMTIAWIEKPPYTVSPWNDSHDSNPHGLILDALLQYIVACTDENTFYESLYADSEVGVLELLRHNTVQVALPIFEPSTNRRYSEFHFVKVHDYPGTDFIAPEAKTNGMDVVLDAVMKSWPLLAVTLILTAIAGVIMWALVGFSWL